MQIIGRVSGILVGGDYRERGEGAFFRLIYPDFRSGLH